MFRNSVSSFCRGWSTLRIALPSSVSRADRVQACGRLVENEQVRVVDQRLGQADAALHALGVFADGSALHRFQTDHLQQHVDALVAGVAVLVEQSAVVFQRFPGVEEPVEIRLFRQVADAFLGGDVRGQFAEHRDPAGRGKQQPEQDFDGGRLARAVGPQQAEHLVRLDVQVELIDRGDARPHPEVLEDLGQPPRLDHRLRCRGRHWFFYRRGRGGRRGGNEYS